MLCDRFHTCAERMKIGGRLNVAGALLEHIDLRDLTSASECMRAVRHSLNIA